MNTVDHLNAALIGRYEIGREIGAGGMATVYLARDLRHQRAVALKLLNPELGAVLGSERFLSEIQVTANLQHPNLLPLFDSGDADGLLFYVMPYIAGETLRARLMREKQLPVDEALHVAVAIASALDYAHRQGVVHRDLKPENILLHEGQPLIADFGIALAVSRAGGNRITQTGLSLGTPQYMSPEQATGDRSVDGRTDIYSLGAMLYEMLAGDPPYTGSTTQAIIAKVITERPRSVRLSRDSVPVHVDAAIDRALAKLPADRWHTAHQFADALQGRVVSLPSGAATPAPAPAVGERRFMEVLRRLATSPLWAAAFIVAAIIAGWERYRRELPSVAPFRFALSLLPSERLALTVMQPITISPNGRSVVYVGARQLYVRDMDRLQTRALAGTEDAISPAVSPDGKWVAFTSLGKLKKVPIDGGPATILSDAVGPMGVSWLSTDDVILSKSTRTRGMTLWRVPAGGGDSEPLAALDSASGERFQMFPYAYARERLVLYTSLGKAGISGLRIAAFSLKTGKTTQLNIEGTYVLGVVLGQLVYVRGDGAVMAVPFDARSVKVSGSPIPLVEGVQVQVGAAAAAISPTGTLVYLRGATTSQVMLVDEHGASRTLVDEKRRYFHPRYSPDGRLIAFDVGSAQSTDVWVADIASGTFTRLTTIGNSDRPEWSPNGKRILFLTNRDTSHAPWGVWWQPADGSAPAERIVAGNYDIREAILTPDGRAVVYREDNAQTRGDILLVPLDTARVPRPLLTSEFDELMPRVSPDGRWLAYISDESGQAEVYLAPFPSVAGRMQVSAGGGMEPLWSPDGSRLFYRNGAQVIAATIAFQVVDDITEHDDAGLAVERKRSVADSRAAVSVTGRTVLFEADFSTHPYHPNYDVARDGKHFVMLKPSSDETQLIVVVNWIEELRQRVRGTP